MDNLIKFIEIFHEQLRIHSFQEVKDREGNQIPGIYIRRENPVLYILGVFEKENQQNMTHMLTNFTNQMSHRLEELHCTHLVSLSILLAEEEEDFSLPPYLDERIHGVQWRYSLHEKKLFSEKGQPNQLLGIEKLLFLASNGERAKEPLKPAITHGKPWACISIFALCVVLLGYSMFLGGGERFIYAFGLSRSAILQGEYYRFFTSMFLHGGIAHLASNSIFLYYFGVNAEYLLGRRRFLALYFLSGLCGGLFSIAFHDVLAIGASGAIYGLLGAMLILTKKYGPRYTGMNYATMLLLAFTSIGLGFLDMGVDNFAHIGGFFGGMIVFLWFMKISGQER